MDRQTHEDMAAVQEVGPGSDEAFDVPVNPHMFRERLRELATRHLDSVRHVCKRYVQNPHDADDLAQEVLVKAARAWEARSGCEPPPGWLYRVTINHCNDHLRRRRRQEALLGRYLVEWQCDAASGDSGGAAVDCVRESEVAYGTLPAKLARGLCQLDRRIAYLRYVIGLKQEDIARVTGLTRPAISKRLAAIRERAVKLYPQRPGRSASCQPA